MRRIESRRKVTIAVLAVVLVLVLSTGGTLAYFTSDDHACTTYRMTAVGMTFNESWDPASGIGVNSGDSMVKEPTFTNTDDESYLLVTVTFEQGDAVAGGGAGNITDPQRLSLILGTLYYDPLGSIVVGKGYTQAELAALPGVQRVFNTAAFEDMTDAHTPAGTRWYGSKGVLARCQSATLFSKVAIPSDYTAADMALMGNYTVSVQGRAIQAQGFSSRADAFAALLGNS